MAVGELVGNAVDHAGGPIWVSLDWSGTQPVLAVHDLGPTFEFTPRPPATTAERGRGLWMVSQISADLAIAAKRAGGKRVTVTLPVSRADELSFDPPPRDVNPLPSLSEAGPDGFSRETLLRAMVVELALAIEESNGPAAAQSAIARVGASIGSQTELEYRRANAIVAPLTPAEIAECYLRLKTSIGAGFYPIEITEDRIVLGNTRCPFGASVLSQPALCRLTSSVLGGIAARNHGEAVVTLDERIAFGDPECRVTVRLRPAPPVPTSGHHYGRAPAIGQPNGREPAIGQPNGREPDISQPNGRSPA